jgi:hypothetical protein
MSPKKRTDAYPLELPSTIPKDEKEIREAEAKLAAMRKAEKGTRAEEVTSVNVGSKESTRPCSLFSPKPDHRGK